MNIYAGTLPVVHLIQCVFHSHFPLIYFIPWAPIGNDLCWLCLPGICHKGSQLLLLTLQQTIMIKCKPQKSSPASLFPHFPRQQSINGSSTAPLGFTEERRPQLTEWDRPNKWHEGFKVTPTHFLPLSKTSFRRVVPSKHKCPGIFKVA